MSLSSTAAHEALIGSVIADRYRVMRVIGKGGMGAVYEAEHIEIGRRVAIKKLMPRDGDQREALARFRREAEVVAGFQHPHIVAALDWVVMGDGSPCIVMEHLVGEDLESRIQRKRGLDWPELARIADEVLSALAVAHRAGIVHRDLKPQNIFLAIDDEGRESVKLLDFGVSKIRGSSALVTSETQVIGTPAYMAPEQAEGRPDDVSAQTDLWAMGVLLFEMATGVLPFRADTVPTLLYQICHREPDDLRSYRTDVPDDFVRAVERCLSVDASERPDSAVALRDQLRDALEVAAPASFRAAVPPRLVVTPTRGRKQPATGTMTTLSASACSLTLPTPHTMTRTRSRSVTAGLILSLLVGAGGVTAALMSADASSPAHARSARPDTAATAPKPAPAPPPPGSSAEGRAASAEASPVAPPDPPEALRRVLIASEPAGANVFDRDNRYLGITPLSVELATGEELEVTVRKRGYLSRRATLAPDGDDAVSLDLTRTRKRKRIRTTRPAAARPVAHGDTRDELREVPRKKLRGPYAQDL